MTVSDKFKVLVEKVQPLGTELSRAESHASSIRSGLENAFGLVDFRVIGSHERGSAIRIQSDVDYLSVLERDDARWGGAYVSSNTFLGNVRDALGARFPYTNVTRDGVALTVHFTDGAVDVVPAVFHSMQVLSGSTVPVYRMADGVGGWMQAAPRAHNLFIAEAEKRSGGKLSRVAQLLKFWRHTRSTTIPLLSFHTEMLLASADVCTGAKTYQQCLAEAFNLIASRGARALQDPVGVSGLIPSAYTQAQVSDVAAAAAYAADKSARALAAEHTYGGTNEAYYYWDLVFNGRFP
jgi:hypothetical protein